MRPRDLFLNAALATIAWSPSVSQSNPQSTPRFGIIGGAGPAFAQSKPHVTVDATYGIGGHSESAGATWYRRDSNVDPRLAVAATTAVWRRLTAVVSAEYVGQWGAGDALSNCSPAPNGTCRKYFPRLQGAGAGVGARVTTGAFTFGTGIARVGGFRWDAVDADVDVGLGRHAGFVVAARAAWRREATADQIDFWPVNVGFRFTL
jgi:hypothetical protein